MSGRPSISEYKEYHDFLNAFLHSELVEKLNDDTLLVMKAYRDVFCWILGHDNQSFPENMMNWSDGFDKHFNLNDEYPN